MAKTRNKSLYDEFLINFPFFKDRVKSYQPKGKNSIVITLNTGKQMLFKKESDEIKLQPV